MVGTDGWAVNIVVVIGSTAIHAELQRRLEKEKTAHGESITVLLLDKSDGVQGRDTEFMKAVREAAIKEYFFGDAKRTLSPFTQSVSFDDVAIFKAPDGMVRTPSSPTLFLLTSSQTQTSTTTRRLSSQPRSRPRCHIGHSQL